MRDVLYRLKCLFGVAKPEVVIYDVTANWDSWKVKAVAYDRWGKNQFEVTRRAGSAEEAIKQAMEAAQSAQTALENYG